MVRAAQFLGLLSLMLVVATSARASAPPTPPGCTTSTVSPGQATPTAIADNGVTTSTIVVSGAGDTIGDVDVITDITHAFNGDVDMTLASPEGTVVTLTTDNGGSFDNVFHPTRWSDQANPGGTAPYTTTPNVNGNNPGLAQDHVYVNNVAARNLAPEEPLGAFVGEDPNGTWTLTISDDAAALTGTLASWQLDIQSVERAPASSAVTVDNPTDFPISGTGTPTVASTITFSGLPTYITDVAVGTSITHTFTEDLQIVLTSPAGTSVTLASNPGGNLDNILNGTIWDDDANPLGQVPYTTNPGLAADHPYVNNVAVPQLAPVEGLAAFTGEDPNGTWTLTVADRFDSEGGNLDQWSLTVGAFSECDSVAPDTAISAGPAEGSTSASPAADFTFAGTPAIDVDHLECSLDSATFTPCTSPASFTGLSDGQHRLRVAAVDAAGNRDATPAERNWTVDTTPPVTEIDSGPGEGSSTSSRAASFTYSGSPGADVSGFRCSLDGAAAEPCPSGGSTFTGLGDGAHEFRVAAVDAAGNADPTPAVRRWTVAQFAAAPPPGPPAPPPVLPGACANTITGLLGSAAGDKLTGTSAGETLDGRAGDDCIDGLGGNDRLVGGTGADRLRGGPGNDRLTGSAGNDELSGDAGNDTLTGGAGTNRYSGGAGNDVISARNRVRETVNCGAGRDRATVDRSDRVRGCERVSRR